MSIMLCSKRLSAGAGWSMLWAVVACEIENPLPSQCEYMHLARSEDLSMLECHCVLAAVVGWWVVWARACAAFS